MARFALSRYRDYPRACGETHTVRLLIQSPSGLSPRLRGNHPELPPAQLGTGTIPAPAGKPRRSAPTRGTARDYPRACGETADTVPCTVLDPGLSPRLRGNRQLPCRFGSFCGTIPAPAGKPIRRQRETPPERDYPRACGETWPDGLHSNYTPGLSPRLRGNHREAGAAARGAGTIPAPAGKPVTLHSRMIAEWDYPRACGETTPNHRNTRYCGGLSPRLRGNQLDARQGKGHPGTIPAPAGKPYSFLMLAWPDRDYPRACGETSYTSNSTK